jgi:putative Mg2+ transporter-C (MgtC) family protein
MGLDRGEHGRPAGLRTTLLVCLAACIAMIQTNLLLSTRGRTGDSFIMLDLMRLPLGILTGMGFIGGGAILRRDGFVLGVTTAAVLWFVTVIGLCFGGGQIGLGIASLALGMVVLSGLRWFEIHMKQDQYGVLCLTTEGDDPQEEIVRALAQKAGYRIDVSAVTYINQTQRRDFEFRVKWRGTTAQKLKVPSFLAELLSSPQVVTAQWKVSS